MTSLEPASETRILEHIFNSQKRVGRQKLHSLICRYLEKPHSECDRVLLDILPLDFDREPFQRYGRILFNDDYDNNSVFFIKRIIYLFDSGNINAASSFIENNLDTFLKRRIFRIEILFNIIWSYFRFEQMDTAKKYLNLLLNLDFKDGDIDCPPQLNFIDSLIENKMPKETIKNYEEFYYRWYSVYDVKSKKILIQA
jgi:hypothetical protein